MRKQEQQQPRLIPPRLWNVRETAEYLGVPTSTLYYWSYLGEGAHGSCGSGARSGTTRSTWSSG